MISKVIKILLIIILGYLVFLISTEDGAYWTKFKLYRLLLTKPIEKIREDYSLQSCKEFSAEEETKGYFEAFITGYCKPKVSEYKDRHDFLCAIALNCSCPNGTNEKEKCSSNSLSWSACTEFNDSKIAYCNKTASTIEPKTGHVAADWNCFPENTPLEIDNQTYKVTDKGGIIKGRRVDIWFDNCNDALKATGIYKIKIPKL
ncbi:MAG: 3D domain-containing protein [Candidatus Falkowbacteria bacterium]|nr:3D domain-containing protein [Candidatus Falkowbacteria bacterium]